MAPKHPVPGLRHKGLEHEEGQPDWLNMPEVPLAEEILSPGLLPPYSCDGHSWSSKKDYVKCQYLMLRYDGTESLREAVRSYRENPAMCDDDKTCIYEDVCINMFLYSALAMVTLPDVAVLHRCTCKDISSQMMALPVACAFPLAVLCLPSNGRARLDSSRALL